jgi:hypothetical protein
MRAMERITQARGDGPSADAHRNIGRRRILRGLGSAAGLVMAPAILRGVRAEAASPAGSLFSLGVASAIRMRIQSCCGRGWRRTRSMAAACATGP